MTWHDLAPQTSSSGFVDRITNISAYLFAPLTDLKSIKDRLLKLCRAQDLKGTILVAPEGINLFVAGRHVAVEELVFEIRSIPGLGNLQPKYSESAEQPFTRMLVRLKKEIIAFGVEGINPAHHTSPRIKPRDLKQWLDVGKDFVLLDTRNDYEVKLGTFKDAEVIGIDNFRDFPRAADELPETLRKKPVVTFCTGGIRCEKAAPMMERLGFEEVYQLDGGILKYFEEVGGDHYDGECFVFDHRVGLDPALRESGSVVCFACQTPLTAEEAKDPRYVPNESCPYCYKPDEQQRREGIDGMQKRLDCLAESCPGSTPEDSAKPIRIPGRCDRMPLVEALGGIFPQVEPEEWVRKIENGRIVGPDGGRIDPTHRVRSGEQYVRVIPQDVEPEVNGRITLIDQDEALIVINKPAPLPMHPCGRFRRNTLENFLRLAWAPEVPRPAHRLDANTSGVVVCARSRHFAKLVQPQFAQGGISKEYLALVRNHPGEDRFTIEAPISTERGAAGLREVDLSEGLPAETEVEVLERRADGTSLLRVIPRTGRTNQIRIHLWHAGFPIVGDPAYLPGGITGERQTLAPDDPPLCLHSYRLELQHPIDGKRVSFTAPAPSWAESLVKQ